MNFLKVIQLLLLLLLSTATGAAALWAQETQEPQDQQQEAPGKPKPAARGIPAMSDPNATIDNENEPASHWQPDTGPATGLQAPTLGSPELAHSYWIPGLIYGSTIESRPPGELPNNGWYANNYVGGEVSLLAAGTRSQFGLNYSGGGYFTTDSLQKNGWFSQLAVGDTITLNHWQIQLFDFFSYIPESQFGFATGTGLALPGVGGTLGPAIPGLGISIIPNQSIYSAIGPRYSNAFATQITYEFTRRSSITLGGSYGLLRFTEPGNVDNDMTIGSVGYNYLVGPHDTIGVLYRFAGFHYVGQPQALGSQIANFVYQKKIAKKVALSLFGGPQFTHFRVPVANQTSDTGVSAGASFVYGLERGSIGVNYYHGVTAGSGVFLGSLTDEATVSFEHQLGRVWSGTIHFGYSRNAPVAPPAGTSVQTYNDLYGGASISRPFGRNVKFSASYQAAHQSTNLPITTGTTNISSYMQNIIVITLQFQTRPLVLP